MNYDNGMDLVSVFQSIKKEIERRIDCIQKIYFEPKLLWDDKKDGKKYILQPDSNLPPYYYRMKAMDDVKELGKIYFKI